MIGLTPGLQLAHATTNKGYSPRVRSKRLLDA